MRNYNDEIRNRIAFIQTAMEKSGASGIVFGNSGGKDSALVGILCKKACDDTIGLVMPCGSRRNYGEDMQDAEIVASQYGITSKTLDLTGIKSEFIGLLGNNTGLSDMAEANISPRLRMIALYAVAASENRLVAGTGNRSEGYMGYFTKWGDGAYDFNPIADLTVTEIYEFLKFLNAPKNIINKAPSGGLFDGQTDENEMGISYGKIDDFILHGTASESDKEIISRFHDRSEHKRKMPLTYGEF